MQNTEIWGRKPETCGHRSEAENTGG